MSATTIANVAVRGVVAAVPGEPVAVASLGAGFNPDDVERVSRTVGLREVYRAPAGQTAGDLCLRAAERLLESLGWERDSVGGVIMVTQTPDHFLPATACVVHGRLGLPTTAFAFDVGMGCSGYVYGLWMASQFVANGAAARVLLLAGDTISHLLSPDDQAVAMLFGDAGSATALEFTPGAPPMHFVLGTDGRGSEDLAVPAGAFRVRPTAEHGVRVADASGNVRAPTDLYMDGLAIFNFTLQRVPAMVEATLERSGWRREDVDAFLFHQANGFILGKIAKKLQLPLDRVPVNIGTYGNTSLTSIPLLLADDVRDSVMGAEPRRLVLAGFGVGYSWAGAALTVGGLAEACVIRA